MSIRRRIFLAALLLLLLAAGRANAVLNFVPSGFTSDPVATGLPFATGIAFAPDGRIFIALKSGVVRVWENGALRPSSFVNLSAQVNDAHDRGMLGIAVHPDFPQSPYVYLLFTHDPPGVTPDDAAGGRVSRLVRVEADPAQGFNVALPGMQLPRTSPGGPGHVVLLGTNSTLANIGNPSDGRDTTKASCMLGFSMSSPPVEDCIPADERSHTIGSVVFASDGSLFVSSGDGSNYTAVDPRALRAQNLDSLAGKILRIDPDSALGLPDNPYYNALSPGSNRSKLWSSGLRNPFRIAVDPATNDVYIGDVGWSTWEEIDKGKGANFAWPCYEGGLSSGVEGGLTTSVRQPGYETNGATSAACGALYASGLGAVKTPTFTYKHSGTDGYGSTGGASANAGALYSGGSYPATFWGRLFIADYNRRWIRTLSFDAQGVASVANFVKESANGFVQVLRGPDTNLYVVVYHATGSEVRRIRYTAGGNTPPTAVASATPTSGSVPLAVAFSSLASFDPDAQPLGYAWDFGDGATSAQQHPQHTYTASGTYVAELTVSELTTPFASGSEEVVITVGAVPPLAVISAPPDGTSFGIGDVVTYAGSASAGGFPLPPSALRWELREHHTQHLHDDTLGVGAGGDLVMEDHADGVWYEICLTAVDQTLVDTQCVDLLPRQTQVTLDSDPVGALLVYEEEGIQLPAPAIVMPTQGALRTVTAPLMQAWRSFDRWTDGVSTRTRQFTVGSTPLSFTARYLNQPPIAAGAASVAAGPGRLNVGFSGAGSFDPEGGALAYSWNFGDGASGTGLSPAHLYTAPGSFLATLSVSDPAGGVGVANVPVVIPNAAPLASFSAAPLAGKAPLVVSFDATASSDADGDGLAYAWDFGDGATGAGATTSHTYTTPGAYTATLGVADPFAATGTHQLGVTVGAPNQPPLAIASAAPRPASTGFPVAFDASASSDPDGAIASYAWSFGDGGNAAGPAPSHSYATPGSYSASVTVTDDEGAASVAAVLVSVVVAQCSDGLDNDGNGATDFSADPGCVSASDLVEAPAGFPCADGVDGDGDGLVDHPADPGCAAADSQREDPPCQDGRDNDGQLGIDFDGGAAANAGVPLAAADPDCAEPTSGSEWPAGGSGCGLGPELAVAMALLLGLRRRARRTR